MSDTLSLIAVVLVTLIIALPFPLLIFAYSRLRLSKRRENLKAKIHELGLEREYLKVFAHADSGKRPAVETDNASYREIQAEFDQAFDNQFQWDNSGSNFLVPLLLTLLTTVLFALVILRSLLAGTPAGTVGGIEILMSGALPLAITGAMLYVLPLYISRYGSFSLNPLIALDLLAKLWLAVILGVAISAVVTSALQPITAFIGGLVPVAALDLLQKRVFEPGTAASQGESARRVTMLEILGQDEDLLAQLNYIGIRSVLELAYENPLKVFIETDLNLEACIYLADAANLYLYVPDQEIRNNLNQHGIKTAVDLMTQTYEYDEQTETGGWLDMEKDPPPHLAKALEAIAQAMKLQGIDALTNLIDTMSEDPKLTYLLSFWQHLNRRIYKISVEEEPAPEQSVQGQIAVHAPSGNLHTI